MYAEFVFIFSVVLGNHMIKCAMGNARDADHRKEISYLEGVGDLYCLPLPDKQKDSNGRIGPGDRTEYLLIFFEHMLK